MQIYPQEVLRTHNVIFWMDSSVRFTTSNLSSAVEKANSNVGVVMFEFAEHSIYSATHEGMFGYLPIANRLSVHTGMYGANAILIYNNREVNKCNNITCTCSYDKLSNFCSSETNQRHFGNRRFRSPITK